MCLQRLREKKGSKTQKGVRPFIKYTYLCWLFYYCAIFPSYTPNGQLFGFPFYKNIVKRQEATTLDAHDYPGIDCDWTEQQQLDELYEGLSSNSNLSARKKCLTVYLRAKSYQHDTVADIARAIIRVTGKFLNCKQ
jgi:hypothetical protein